LTSRGAVNRRKAEAAKKSGSQITPGLPEQDSEHDPTARSSHEPELPVADESGDESDGPPGIEESDGESTVDYRNFDDSFEDFEDAQEEDDDEPHAFAFSGELISREEFLQCIQEDANDEGSDKLRDYLSEHGTQVEHAPVEALDMQNGANECWSSTEPDMYHLQESGVASPAEPVEVQLSPQMSLLLVPMDGETLPELRHEDEYYVVRVYPSGVKRTVVERKENILSRDEALQHEKACNQAMLDELKRMWWNLGASERVSKEHANNVIDARWVFA